MKEIVEIGKQKVIVPQKKENLTDLDNFPRKLPIVELKPPVRAKKRKPFSSGIFFFYKSVQKYQNLQRKQY